MPNSLLGHTSELQMRVEQDQRNLAVRLRNVHTQSRPVRRSTKPYKALQFHLEPYRDDCRTQRKPRQRNTRRETRSFRRIQSSSRATQSIVLYPVRASEPVERSVPRRLAWQHRLWPTAIVLWTQNERRCPSCSSLTQSPAARLKALQVL